MLLDAYYPFSPALVAAGFLHDVIEDTPVTRTVVAEVFGPEIAALVDEVTVRPGVRWSLAGASADACRLKAADLSSNIEDAIADLRAYGPVIWARFAAGSRKADTWAAHAPDIAARLPGEPLITRLLADVEAVRALR